MQKPEKEFVCVVCGEKFTRRTYHAKYCDNCRYSATLEKAKEYQRAKRRGTFSEETIYTCIRCGRKILAHGVCTTRKVCNDCFSKDRLMKYNYRKEVVEEVLPDE